MSNNKYNVYQSAKTPIYSPQQQNIGIGNENQIIDNGLNVLKDNLVGMITEQQITKSEQDLMEANLKTNLAVNDLKVKYSGDPTNPKFLSEAQHIYNENMQGAINNAGSFVKQKVKDQYNRGKSQNDYELASWQLVQGREVNIQKLKDLLKLQNNSSYEAGKKLDQNFFKTLHKDDDNFKSQLINIYGEYGIEEKMKALTNDKITMYASGLLETNPSIAKQFIAKNREAIGGETSDKLTELAGQRIVSFERWNTTKNAIAGDKIYRDGLNSLYDGNMSIADAYNFVESNPQLSQHEKEFFIKTANQTWESKTNGSNGTGEGNGTGERLTAEHKALALNDLNELYNIVSASDSEAVKQNLNAYSQLLNGYLSKGLITKEEYKNYSEKIIPFENEVLQSNYSNQYDRKRSLNFDYSGTRKVNELANDVFYNLPNPNDGVMQGNRKTRQLQYSLFNYLTPTYNPKFSSKEKLDNFIRERVDKVNNPTETEQSDDIYYKTNKFAIGFTNYVYREMTNGMDELIKKEATERKLDFETYKQSLNTYDLERRQNLVLEALSKRFIIQNTNLTERQVDEAGYKNILNQQNNLQKSKYSKDMLFYKANTKIFDNNNLVN
jgi:hypothetical protein